MESLLPKYFFVKLQRGKWNANGNFTKNNDTIKPTSSINVKLNNDNIVPYDLCGIITHIGSSLSSGHYIAEVKYGETWFKCNDAQVSLTSYQELSDSGYGYLFQKK